MTKEEFVKLIYQTSVKEVVEGFQEKLIKPPGRSPKPKLIQMSEFFKKLTDSDREILVSIINEAAEFSIFNTLCMLDGVSRVADGEFQLYFKAEGVRKRYILNEFDDGMLLHDLFNIERGNVS